MPESVNTPQWVTPKVAAEIIDSTPASMANMRFMRKGPAYSKFGRAVRYKIKDLEDFMGGTRIDPQATA